jgi:hypothetical protein
MLFILIYTLFVIRWSPKEITQHRALVNTILMFIKIKMLYFLLNEYFALSTCEFFAWV